MNDYDMCVEYDVLCSIEMELKKIEADIDCSVDRMKAAISRSQDFLEGYQFEKARYTTEQCVSLTTRTRQNIQNARDYVTKLRETIEEYSRYGYPGDAK